MNIVEELTPRIDELCSYARELKDEKLDNLIYKVLEQLIMLDLETN